MTIFEILDYQETALGPLILRRRELLSKPGTIVTEVTLNHEFLMSSYLTESERELSRIGLQLVRQNRNSIPGVDRKLSVLVGGLGLGYTAAEALESDDVDLVEVVEFLQPVIDWLVTEKIPLATKLKTDRRLKVNLGDIYFKLMTKAESAFDLIAIDVDHSPEDVLGEQSYGFYSVASLRAARESLQPGGVLAIWSYAADTPLLDNMRTVFSAVQVNAITVWNDLIAEEQTDWLFFGTS